MFPSTRPPPRPASSAASARQRVPAAWRSLIWDGASASAWSRP